MLLLTSVQGQQRVLGRVCTALLQPVLTARRVVRVLGPSMGAGQTLRRMSRAEETCKQHSGNAALLCDTNHQAQRC